MSHIKALVACKLKTMSFHFDKKKMLPNSFLLKQNKGYPLGPMLTIVQHLNLVLP